MIRTRISKLKLELEKIERNRDVQRKSRNALYSVALVGYTNAGKSTLFNQLTQGAAEAVDKLFATLDSKTHRSAHPLPRSTVFIDTVGFIRKLPHHLVASFRSTMEEAVSADLVLHVINLAHPQVEEQRTVGRAVLEELGISAKNVVEVYNKIDMTGGEVILEPYDGDSVFVSALAGKGIDRLVGIVAKRELDAGRDVTLAIPHSESRLLAFLNEVGSVRTSEMAEDHVLLSAWVPLDQLHQFEPFLIEEPERNSAQRRTS
jgi:GTP-binding protein HflX